MKHFNLANHIVFLINSDKFFLYVSIVTDPVECNQRFRYCPVVTRATQPMPLSLKPPCARNAQRNAAKSIVFVVVVIQISSINSKQILQILHGTPLLTETTNCSSDIDRKFIKSSERFIS